MDRICVCACFLVFCFLFFSDGRWGEIRFVESGWWTEEVGLMFSVGSFLASGDMRWLGTDYSRFGACRDVYRARVYGQKPARACVVLLVAVLLYSRVSLFSVVCCPLAWSSASVGRLFCVTLYVFAAWCHLCLRVSQQTIPPLPFRCKCLSFIAATAAAAAVNRGSFHGALGQCKRIFYPQMPAAMVLRSPHAAW